MTGRRPEAAARRPRPELALSLGRHIGVEYKAGVWHDVAWLQRPLVVGDDPPAEVR